MARHIEEADAQRILAPYHDAFWESVSIAWREWTVHHLPFVPTAPQFRPAALGSMMHSTIERELRMRLGANPALFLPSPEQNRFFIYEKAEEVLVSPKKLDRDYLVSNYPTRRSNNFNAQRPVDELIPSGPRLTLGYRLTPGNDQFLGLYVAYLRSKQVIWKYEIQSGGTTTIMLPSQPMLPLAPTGLRLKLLPGGKDGTQDGEK
jgi:hypothetical protein